MKVREILGQCGGCCGGKHPDPTVCPCSDIAYDVQHKIESKYPFGSIDIGTELGLETDLTNNVRYQAYQRDLEMEIQEFLAQNNSS